MSPQYCLIRKNAFLLKLKVLILLQIILEIINNAFINYEVKEKEEDLELEKLAVKSLKDSSIQAITFENLRKKNQYLKVLLSKISATSLDISLNSSGFNSSSKNEDNSENDNSEIIDTNNFKRSYEKSCVMRQKKTAKKSGSEVNNNNLDTLNAPIYCKKKGLPFFLIF